MHSVQYTIPITDWKPVERSVKIPFDLEATPLQIKSSSEGELNVKFYTAGGVNAGTVSIYASGEDSTYNLYYCMVRSRDYPSNAPTDVNKVWTITKLPGPKITVHCNGVYLFEVSEDSCDDSGWREVWGRDVEEIMFHHYDRLSEEYRAGALGNLFTIFSTLIIIL